MRLGGVTLHEFLKVGLMASVFILLAKYVGGKSKVPALQATTAAL